MKQKQIINGGDEVGAWVFQRSGGEWTKGRGASLGLLEDGHLVAGVAYDNWNGASICMHVAAERPVTWLTRPFAWIAFHYPFEQLGVRKVIGLVSSTNEAAIRFNLSLGFVREATLAEASPNADLIIFTMMKHQCRWLNWNQNGKAQSTSSPGLSRGSD